MRSAEVEAIVNPARVQEILKRRAGRTMPSPARRLLALNTLPHPRWLDPVPNALALLAKNGAIWVVGALGAYLLGIPRSGRTLRELLPSLLGASLLAQALKRLVRRPRSWTARLRARALGIRLRSSFPSGDAASAFAGAWVLGTVWPRWAPLFLGLAAALGLTRVYVGAHRLSEVAAGAILGVGLAELVRRAAGRLLAQWATTPAEPVSGCRP